MAKKKVDEAVPCSPSGDKKTDGYHEYEIDDACRILTRAEEIKQDDKLMAAVQKKLKRQMKTIRSIADLRDAGRRLEEEDEEA